MSRTNRSRRKATKKAKTSKHYELHRLGRRYMWRCHFCRALVHCRTCDYGLDPTKAATRDHYVPMSKGGRKGNANIVLACSACNAAKADQMPDEFHRKAS